MRTIHWVQAGPLDKRTGGFIYNKRIVTGLRARGFTVELVSLPERFPAPDAAARAQADAAFAALPDGALTVVDGLVYGVLPELMAEQSGRLRLIALCHHPLALETGLSADRAVGLMASEKAALHRMHAVVTTSTTTAETLAPFELPAAMPVHTVPPGTDPAPLARGSAKAGDGSVALLCVASLTARKGHRVLIEALAGLRGLPWHLVCAGGSQHEPETAEAIARRIEETGLHDRVRLAGELDEEGLSTLYDRADLFVLPSLHEGYGMVLTEALARGLPIVGTRAGAIPEVVPRDACVLVAPGDPDGLRDALARLMSDPAERRRLAEGARTARARLRGWEAAVEAFAAVLEAC